MTSIFSPVDYQKFRTLKVTSSSQEWCGNTFMQLNFRNNKYHAEVRSYFQKEGDQDTDLPVGWLEDELWTRIRLAPTTLPVGEVDLIPSLQYLRLWHNEVKPQKAVVSIQTITDKNVSANPLEVYSVEYKEIPRKLVIRFEKEFPYSIVEWEETQPGGFGDSKPLTTRAIRTNSILLDYWNTHRVEDGIYRKKLGLTEQ
jgi:hypothetical protein